MKDRAREIAIQLTQWRSVTGTREECAFPGLLAALMGQHAYFKAHPDHLRVEPLNDGSERANLIALVHGSGSRTVVLTGHFDTVPFDDYGALMPYACDPEFLLPLAIDRLKQTGEDAQALADFESGNYLPGRGLLDMKAGLAAGIAVLEAFAEDENRVGNILFVATPDEEDRSAGMRAAARMIPEIAADSGLDVALVINLDSIADDGDGSFGASVTMGSIGKLLLTALVVGREAHACYPFAGVNANYLAAALLARFECAPELAEARDGEIAAPPTALHAKDLKDGYNVTTPARVFLYWNTLQFRRAAEEVMEIAERLAEAALDRAIAELGDRASLVEPPQHFPHEPVPVLRFAALREAAREADPAFDAGFATLAEELAERADLDFPTRSRLLTEFTWASSRLAGPAVILGFGSIPYAAVSLGDDALVQRIMDAVGPAAQRLHYFPGISDMSFLGRASGDFAVAEANTPIWGSSFTLSPSPAYPVINIGPWGRDYHHWLERLNAPYAFDILPRLVLRATKAALE
ncbi:MAG: M20/M25/M40 family metallo-hydrolase [Parvibaculaceae bacterium]